MDSRWKTKSGNWWSEQGEIYLTLFAPGMFAIQVMAGDGGRQKYDPILSAVLPPSATLWRRSPAKGLQDLRPKGKSDAEWREIWPGMRMGTSLTSYASRFPVHPTRWTCPSTTSVSSTWDRHAAIRRQLASGPIVLDNLEDPLFELSSENSFERGLVFFKCDRCGESAFPKPDKDDKLHRGHTCEERLEAARQDFTDVTNDREGCSVVRLYWASEAMWYPALHSATEGLDVHLLSHLVEQVRAGDLHTTEQAAMLPPGFKLESRYDTPVPVGPGSSDSWLAANAIAVANLLTEGRYVEMESRAADFLLDQRHVTTFVRNLNEESVRSSFSTAVRSGAASGGSRSTRARCPAKTTMHVVPTRPPSRRMAWLSGRHSTCPSASAPPSLPRSSRGATYSR